MNLKPPRLSIDEETGSLKTDNPYLHDNVD